MMQQVHTAAARCRAPSDLDAHLKQFIRGQDPALTALSGWAIRAALGLTALAPRALFLGPTGVGKTETALLLSQAVFGRDPFRFDMSEFQRPESLEVLLGDRSGDRGRLGTLCRQAEEGLLLLDEIEKAHPKILDLLLQILEPGHISLASGERCDLSQFFVICTSNIATAELLEVRHSTQASLERHVFREAEQRLRPEIVNRFDELLLFRPLDYDAQVEIARQHLERFIADIAAKGYRLTLAAGVVEFLMREGFNRRYGARPLLRAIRRFVGDAVVASLATGGTGSGRLGVNAAGTSLIVTRADHQDESPAP